MTTPAPGTVTWKSTPTFASVPMTKSTNEFRMLGASFTVKPVTELKITPRACPWNCRRTGNPLLSKKVVIDTEPWYWAITLKEPQFAATAGAGSENVKLMFEGG